MAPEHEAQANNAEIDVIWDEWQAKLEPLREQLNEALGTNWQEWEIPRELTTNDTNRHESKKGQMPSSSSASIRENSCSFVVKIHQEWWSARISRQQEIDKSIAARADFEFLYNKPYDNKKCVRVAGPFTVESLSPHRMLGVDEDDEWIDPLDVKDGRGEYNEESFFVCHAYFHGANDPYSALKTTLKAEINPEAWATLNSDTSRRFDKPKQGSIAVKVINHLGDEVMKCSRSKTRPCLHTHHNDLQKLQGEKSWHSLKDFAFKTIGRCKT